jgi:hypothetical protein
MIEDAEGPAAYTVLRDSPGVVRWLEHGARPGGDRRVDDLFWAAIARARRRGMKRLEGWSLPGGPAGEALYPIARRARTNPIVMIRALSPALRLPRFEREDECRIPELDSF